MRRTSPRKQPDHLSYRKLHEDLAKIFGYYTLEKVWKSGFKLVFDAQSLDLDCLSKLAIEFGTSNISLRSDTRVEGCCEICESTTSVIELEVEGVRTNYPKHKDLK